MTKKANTTKLYEVCCRKNDGSLKHVEVYADNEKAAMKKAEQEVSCQALGAFRVIPAAHLEPR